MQSCNCCCCLLREHSSTPHATPRSFLRPTFFLVIYEREEGKTTTGSHNAKVDRIVLITSQQEKVPVPVLNWLEAKSFRGGDDDYVKNGGRTPDSDPRPGSGDFRLLCGM